MARANAPAPLSAVSRNPDAAEPPSAIDRLARTPVSDRVDHSITAVTVLLALAVALIAGAGAALYQHTRPAVYFSYATLEIDQPSAIVLSNDDGPLGKLQQLRYQYAGLLQTDVIGVPVGRQLNLPAKLVEGSLGAIISPSNFNLIVVADGSSPSRPALLAQAAAQELSSYVQKQQSQVGLSSMSRVLLTEVVNPVSGVKKEPTRTRQWVSGLVAFVVVGIGFLIVADLVRRRRSR